MIVRARNGEPQRFPHANLARGLVHQPHAPRRAETTCRIMIPRGQINWLSVDLAIMFTTGKPALPRLPISVNGPSPIPPQREHDRGDTKISSEREASYSSLSPSSACQSLTTSSSSGGGGGAITWENTCAHPNSFPRKKHPNTLTTGNAVRGVAEPRTRSVRRSSQQCSTRRTSRLTTLLAGWVPSILHETRSKVQVERGIDRAWIVHPESKRIHEESPGKG